MVGAASVAERNRLIELFADLLEYPRTGVIEQAHECLALLGDGSQRAAEMLDRFTRDLERIPLARIEEIYTGAFDLDTLSDLDATCYPYVGHHLLGETYKRSTFMLELQQRYTAHEFVVERELPDHLVVMLRFLVVCPDDELAEELVADAILPALSQMTRDDQQQDALAGEEGRSVYLRVLEALRLTLGEVLWPEALARAAATENALEEAS